MYLKAIRKGDRSPWDARAPLCLFCRKVGPVVVEIWWAVFSRATSFALVRSWRLPFLLVWVVSSFRSCLLKGQLVLSKPHPTSCTWASNLSSSLGDSLVTEQVCDGSDISHEEAGNWEEQTHGNLLVHSLPCGWLLWGYANERSAYTQYPITADLSCLSFVISFHASFFFF